MADYSEFADPIRVRSWQRYVEDDGDLHALLHEATGHAVAMRDAIAAGDDRVHSGDRALYLVDVLNLARAAAGLIGRHHPAVLDIGSVSSRRRSRTFVLHLQPS